MDVPLEGMGTTAAAECPGSCEQVCQQLTTAKLEHQYLILLFDTAKSFPKVGLHLYRKQEEMAQEGIWKCLNLLHPLGLLRALVALIVISS